MYVTITALTVDKCIDDGPAPLTMPLTKTALIDNNQIHPN